MIYLLLDPSFGTQHWSGKTYLEVVYVFLWWTILPFVSIGREIYEVGVHLWLWQWCNWSNNDEYDPVNFGVNCRDHSAFGIRHSAFGNVLFHILVPTLSPVTSYPRQGNVRSHIYPYFSKFVYFSMGFISTYYLYAKNHIEKYILFFIK